MNSIFTLTVEKSKLTLPTANEKQGMLTGVPLPPPTHCAALSHAVCLVPLLFICIYLSMLKAESTTCLLLTHARYWGYILLSEHQLHPNSPAGKRGQTLSLASPQGDWREDLHHPWSDKHNDRFDTSVQRISKTLCCPPWMSSSQLPSSI